MLSLGDFLGYFESIVSKSIKYIDLKFQMFFSTFSDFSADCAGSSSQMPCESDALRQKIGSIRIEDFDYPLPDERIARHPLAQRDACKLLYSPVGEPIRHLHFSDLPDLIPAGSLMIANETKVINARIEFFKESGGRIEVFVLEPSDPADYAVAFACRKRCVWVCMIGNLKRWKNVDLKKSLQIPGIPEPVVLTARLLPLAEGETPSASRRVEFSWDNEQATFADIIEAAGNIPIPPYLKRESEECDLQDYQTVYSRVEGSVAAPTAGLHFTPELFARLDSAGVRQRKVTLHVGAGTFQPVKSDVIGEHPMHTESVVVDLDVIDDIIASLEAGRGVVAVGTTSVRTIESLPLFGRLVQLGSDVASADAMHVGQWDAYGEEYRSMPTLPLLHSLRDALHDAGLDMLVGSTSIMIAPGFGWRIVERMITNFHQPQSTLLLLVSSFLGSTPDDPSPRWRPIYREALDNGYRFLSYGDACLFERR